MVIAEFLMEANNEYKAKLYKRLNSEWLYDKTENNYDIKPRYATKK